MKRTPLARKRSPASLLEETGRDLTKVAQAERGATAPRLPHERDGGTEPETAPRKRTRQALQDVEVGRVDTEARGIPSNVPPPQPARRAGGARKRPRRAKT